ncbi:MAG: DUF1573 domain-containing protein [Paludibacteraceae bacterium]|nr:DUF1573 domain-containing protein [Paludibacteraceae bacterium]
MQKTLITLLMSVMTVAAMAQQPVITFTTTEHDFGKINEADGRVTTVFEFKNEGMEPLVLSNVRASCGCTTPKWTKEPVEPGQSGQITVTYNPNGRPGRFQKTITVTSNASEATKRLYIKGEVIPKPAKPVNAYPVQMGELKLKSKSVDFGEVKKGASATGEIEYANHTDHDIQVELRTNQRDNFLLSQVTLETVKKGETGKLMFILSADACKLYGPVKMEAYVVVNGKLEMSDEYKIDLSADIVEDFSSLTVAERQQAPIATIDDELDFGVMTAGRKYSQILQLGNAGTNPLQVRRLYTTDENMTLTCAKNVIKSGRKGQVKIEINTKQMEPGKYTRIVTVITNDPKTPVRNIKVNWTIQ